MKVHQKLFCSILILFVVILAGCTKKPAVTDLWLDEAYDGKQYGNVLVIGVAEKMTFRNLFEGQIVRQMNLPAASYGVSKPFVRYFYSRQAAGNYT